MKIRRSRRRPNLHPAQRVVDLKQQDSLDSSPADDDEDDGEEPTSSSEDDDSELEVGPCCCNNNTVDGATALPLVPAESLELIRSLPPAPNAAGVSVLGPKKEAKKEYTLVVDLDETLVHSVLGDDDGADFAVTVLGKKVSVRKRPFLKQFLEDASRHFEVVAFTAGYRPFADAVLDVLDPAGNLIDHRLFRDFCYIVSPGRYVKNLNILGRDLSRTVIVDNSLEAFGFHLDNGILVRSWFHDEDDAELPRVMDALMEMLASNTDVPNFIGERFRNKELLVRRC